MLGRDRLGLGDWQHELGVQIVDVYVSTREQNGGAIELGELEKMVNKLWGIESGVITEEDVIRSIKTLESLGAGYEVIDVESGRKIVRNVVKELDQDQAIVLAEAREEGGRIIKEALVARGGWTCERARTALENMFLRDGLCWFDAQDELHGQAHWVPRPCSGMDDATDSEGDFALYSNQFCQRGSAVQ